MEGSINLSPSSPSPLLPTLLRENEVNNAVKRQISVDANGAKLAYDRFNNSGSDPYYSPYKIQNDFSEDSGRLSDSFTSDFSFHEEPSQLYSSWATLEDPYQPMDCAKGNPKNRSLIDGNNYGSEADLYGLVSAILDDGDSMDSYFCQEISTGLRAMWSPSSMKENNLQYLNSKDAKKMLSSSGMQLNPELSSKTHTHPTPTDSNQMAETYQEFSSFETVDPSWMLSVCNGESEAYTQTVPDLTRPPPGLVIPPAVSSHFPKIRAGKSEPGMSGKDSSFCSTADALAEYLNDRTKMEKTRQFSVQDNKLGNTMQALLMDDQEDMYIRESAQNSGMSVQEGKMVDLKNVPFQRMSAFAAHMPSLKRDMAESLREPRGSEFANKSQSLQCNYMTDEFSGLGQQSADYFQPPKSFSSSFNLPNPHQRKTSVQRETWTPQTNLHQYHIGQSNIYQSQTKLPVKSSINTDPEGLSKLMSQSVAEFVPVLSSQQMLRTVPRVHAEFGQGNGMSLQGRMGHAGMGLGLAGLRKVADPGDGEDFDLQLEMSRLSTASGPGFIPDPHSSQWFGAKPKLPFHKEADKKQGLPQNSYQVLGNMYASPARDSGVNSNQTKPVSSQMFRCLYQMGVSGQNPCHLFPSRSSLSCGGSMPVMNMTEPLPDGDFPALNPYLQDFMGPSTVGGDGPFLGSNLRSPKVNKSRGTPTSQLHYYLDECYEQWRMLEKERKKTEAVLVQSYPGKRLTMVSSNSLPKMPPNPSRVDRLIVDQLREQTKVVSLLGKMERLRSFPLHANICSALDRHLEAIYVTQARRKDEFLNIGRQKQASGYLREDREILLLACALKDLCSNTKKSRTALWCALQMTLPKPNTSSEDAGDTPSDLGYHSPDQVVPERVHTM